jgi:hypothetical protein
MTAEKPEVYVSIFGRPIALARFSGDGIPANTRWRWITLDGPPTYVAISSLQ